MRISCLILIGFLTLLFLSPAWAGLYYTGEEMAELPSQWRGFLLDQRMLRSAGIKPVVGNPASPLRVRYEEEAAKLEKLSKTRALTADEAADLGALHVRLGNLENAIEVLRQAQRDFPSHFRIVANLGTAWQLQGDLNQARVCLDEAVRLAPDKHKPYEEYHLKLVQQRLKKASDSQDLDDLFGVTYTSKDDKYEAGSIRDAERQKLPANAIAIVQQLALWLPADGRLLWQLGELANAHGDVRTAAAMMDGCVTEFGMNAPALRQHRLVTRSAADALAQAGADVQAMHETHAGLFKPRSKRPLVNRLDASELPPIRADGVNSLPWSVLADTALDRKYRPSFTPYLKELDGKQVALSGFLQPLSDDLEIHAFMLIEYPVGCWYCEVPDLTGIVFVELERGQTTTLTRQLMKVVGQLTLNSTDPEDFLYTVKNAKVSEAD
ncbi:MAG: DUF3299 domain-containing protein [Gemmataceae bacterium]